MAHKQTTVVAGGTTIISSGGHGTPSYKITKEQFYDSTDVQKRLQQLKKDNATAEAWRTSGAISAYPAAEPIPSSVPEPVGPTASATPATVVVATTVSNQAQDSAKNNAAQKPGAKDKTEPEVQNINPFGPYVPDDRFRPYNAVTVDRDDSIATIVVTEPVKMEEGNPTTDFFTKFVTVLTATRKNEAGERRVVQFDELSTKLYGVFKNFSVMDVNEVTQEAVKVTLNFGLGWTAYFFGQQPRIFSFSGFFLDAKNYPFYEQFMRAYQTYLSGSEIARRGYRFYIAYDGKIISGYMLGINVSSSSGNRVTKSFSFQVLVDDENYFRTNMGAYEDTALNNTMLLGPT